MIPDKTIAVLPIIPNDGIDPFNMKYDLFLKPLNSDHKRDWFTPHFYKCLPLSIGNMQGFVFSVPYNFSLFWNGGINVEDLKIETYEDREKFGNMNFVFLDSEFGHGILTIHFPVVLKTPDMVNLMTIAPPNFITPGLNAMTGVVETDNLKMTFTLNIKVNIDNVWIHVNADTPLVGIIPIPRYYCDSFNLIDARKILDEKQLKEEQKIIKEHSDSRFIQNKNKLKEDKLYYRGMDIRRNKFKDHQFPVRKK